MIPSIVAVIPCRVTLVFALYIVLIRLLPEISAHVPLYLSR